MAFESFDMFHLVFNVTLNYLSNISWWCMCMSATCNINTMGCSPVRGDNPRALASGLSYLPVDKHGITILYHLDQCRP